MFFDGEFVCVKLKGFTYEFCPFQVFSLLVQICGIESLKAISSEMSV